MHHLEVWRFQTAPLSPLPPPQKTKVWMGGGLWQTLFDGYYHNVQLRLCSTDVIPAWEDLSEGLSVGIFSFFYCLILVICWDSEHVVLQNPFPCTRWTSRSNSFFLICRDIVYVIFPYACPDVGRRFYIMLYMVTRVCVRECVMHVPCCVWSHSFLIDFLCVLQWISKVFIPVTDEWSRV